MRRGPLVVTLCAALAAACGRSPFEGPLRLLEVRDVSGAVPRSGALSTGGETRPALLAPARFRVPLPRRPLLTFGIGLSWAGEGEAPGWYRLTVRADGRIVTERSLNPRAARGFRQLSTPLDGFGRETTLEFDLRLSDRD